MGYIFLLFCVCVDIFYCMLDILCKNTVDNELSDIFCPEGPYTFYKATRIRAELM